MTRSPTPRQRIEAAFRLGRALRLADEYVTEAQSLQVINSVAEILHAQSLAVDLTYYEDPSYYDTLHRAQSEAPYRPSRIVSGLVQIAQNGLALAGISAWLLTFNQFRHLLGGRSALIISHRMSTVRMADRIYVMDRGRVAERGSHAELLARDGPYARLYRAQAEQYREP